MSDLGHVELPGGGEGVADPHEQEARDYGWAPKEDFKGPESKWRPAEDYLSWAKQSGRLPKGEFDELKKQFPAMRQENQQLKSKLEEIQGTLTQFVEFSSKAEERAYNKAKTEIEQRIEQAAANADPVAARQATAELQALTPAAPKPVTETKPAVAVDPVIQDWISKEDWFTKDRALNAVATDIFGKLERDSPGMSQSDRLAQTKKLTMEKFPEKFGINPMREGAAAVSTPSGQAAARKSSKKSYDDLPAEAKKACDKFVKQIPGYTRDKYVAAYDWEN